MYGRHCMLTGLLLALPGRTSLGKLLTALSICGLETRKLQSWQLIQLLVSALTFS